MTKYDALPTKLAACLAYMGRFGLVDSAETRAELADVMGLKLSTVETFSRYGRLVAAA